MKFQVGLSGNMPI